MSDDLHQLTVGAPRNLSPKEKELLRVLLRHGVGGNSKLFELDSCMVRRMNDGGMGSLRFEPKTDEQRVFGGVLAEAQFLDRDGVSVCAAINLDKAGNLYELDLWKVDNSALIDFPEPSEITLISKSSEL